MSKVVDEVAEISVVDILVGSIVVDDEMEASVVVTIVG